MDAKSKCFLNDICIIRLILIILLIIYHSLCPYTSAFWDNPQGREIPVFYWVGRLSYCCMLETFVFISGIILGSQIIRKGKEAVSFRHLIIGKLKRLILPSVLFGLLYYVIFMDLSSAPMVMIKSLFEGVGHMWFFPMLYWCFFGIFIINILGINRKEILPVLFILAIFSSLPLPLRLNLSMYYFFFFFFGYCVGSNKIDITKYFTKKTIIYASLIFFVIFPILTYLRYDYDEIYLANKINVGIPLKYKILLIYALQHLCQLIYSINGMFLIYIMVNYLIKLNILRVSTIIVRLSSYCFGVYIFQEFIIRIFYYKLNIIETLNPYVFPIASIVMTLILSITLTHFAIKTKLGKFLLG